MTPLESGLIFDPLAFGFALTSMKSGGWVERLGYRTLRFGCFLLGASYLLFFVADIAFGPDMSGYAWISAALLAGVAMGLISAPLNFVTLAHVKEDEVGLASGVITAGVEISYALGTVAGGMIFYSATGANAGHVHGLAAQTGASFYFQAFHSSIGFNGMLVIGMLVLIRYLNERVTAKRSAE